MKRPYPFSDEYFQKTYAGWLGKNSGIRLGSPIEGWSFDRIRRTYGIIADYPVGYKDYAADDDSNGPNFFIRALLDFGAPETDIQESHMAETWLNYIPDHHGFLWWGGYGISTEHTAYDNLKAGIPAPRSGSIQQNGKTCAEQIGGQIFVDSWGFVFPGDPETAAAYARKMISVSHDGEGLYGGMFIAACVSAAYTAGSLREIIDAGLKVIPDSCHYAAIVRDILEFHRRDKTRNWETCFSYVRDHYGYDKYAGNCHIIPNAAVIILSLLYGEGDFADSLCICAMCGWDTDCNAGNVGAILGVFTGPEGIDDRWRGPINDLLLSSSVIGSLNISTLAETAELFCAIGCRMAKSPLPEPWSKRVHEPGSRLFHFDFLGSTQALRCDDPAVIIRNSNRPVEAGHRSLEATSPKGRPMDLYMKTYYTPADLHDSRYDPSFTPIVFPGQRIRACLQNAGGTPCDVTLYAFDLRGGRTIDVSSGVAPGETKRVTLSLPAMEGGLISRIGLTAASRESAEAAVSLRLDSIEVSGQPEYSLLFSREIIEDFGFHNGGVHKEISQCTVNNGYWELEKDCLSGSCAEEGELYTGYYDGSDYTVSCTLIPQVGLYHLLMLRVQGAARSYAVGFYGENRIALVKKQIHHRVLKSVAFPYDLQREYEFTVRASGNLFTLFVDGEEIFRSRDEDQAYLRGQIGCGVRKGSHCHFKDLALR